ncbi:hypothetical protein [Butyricimonas paravirosa]
MKVACRFMGVRIRFRVTVGVFSEHLRGAFARGARENHRWGGIDFSFSVSWSECPGRILELLGAELPFVKTSGCLRN